MIDLSIIIPSYNNLNIITNCLDSILNQNSHYKYEVIVVDSSDKDDYSQLPVKYPGLKLISLNKRTFPGTARNVGVQKARGKLIAFTDSDCIVASDWIDKILFEHGQRGRILISGSIENGTPQNYIGTSEYIIEFSDFIPQKRSRLVDNIPTCNFSIERELFMQIGQLADVIKGSDTLFCYQVLDKEIPIMFVPSIKVYHQNRCQLNQYLKNQFELGSGAYQIRKIKNIPGTILTKSKILVPFLIPFRVLTTIRKVTRTGLFYSFQLVYTFPLVFLGLVYFTRGFWKGFKLK